MAEEYLRLVVMGLTALVIGVIAFQLFGNLFKRPTAIKKPAKVPEKKPFKPLSPKEKEKRLAQLEKERIKQTEKEDKERARIEKAKEEEKLVKIREKEKKLQEELVQKQEEVRQKEVLTKDIGTPQEKPEPEDELSLFERLKRGVSKTRDHFVHGLGDIVLGKKEINEDILDDLEEVLIEADIGPETTYRILDTVTQKLERQELKDPQALQTVIKEEIMQIMSKEYSAPTTNEKKPLVLLVVGVNGVGKTTTIGKIASQYQQQGKKVLLGAGDTFRAAAIEQLTEWSKRSQCDILSKSEGSDPSAVMYETVQKAVAENYDVVICDTAGRLHTKKNLMEEMKKMVRVIQKLIPDAPHETFLVLDATTGQNAIIQTREFKKTVDLTGLIVTKLDGTAKGGVVIGIVNEFDVPVRYIGIGETIEDLRPFNAKEFAESLFD